MGQPLVWWPLGLQRRPARSPDMWQPKKGFRSDFSRFKNQPKLSAQGLEPGCLLESFLACPWVLQRVVYVQVQFLPDEGGQLLVQVWVFWKYSQTGWQPKWQYCELPKGAVVTEQLLSAGSTLYESKRLSGLGRLTTGPVEGPWRWPRCLHSEARAMHEDIEGGQIVWSASTPLLPCEQGTIGCKSPGEWSWLDRSLVPQPCTDWLRDDHFRDPLGYVVSCPWSLSGGSVTKGILYPHCTMRMTQRSAPISDQAPREFW